jgi:hypothetical protein
MTCGQCKNHFCWICKQSISNDDPYGHFSNGGGDEGLFSDLTDFLNQELDPSPPGARRCTTFDNV